MRLILDRDGPGSRRELVDYVEAVIRENCEMKPHAFLTAVQEDQETKMARAVVTSILARLGISYDS